MFLKLPMTFAKCLKYLCLASNLVVQWFISGPNLKINLISTLRIEMYIALTQVLVEAYESLSASSW